MKYYPWHQKALNHIAEQIRENRQPHATLFRLREGYNDSALGLQMCKYLLCDDVNAPDQCRHARLVDEQSHPNVICLDIINNEINFSPVEKRRVGINDVRELEQQMWQTSMFDKPKVAYIQGLDLLSLGAQNALLKTLEEPPKNTFFILSVQNISRIIPTIMSRVQRLRHGQFEQERLLHWLQNQLENPMTEAEIAKTAKLVDFAPINALALLTSHDGIQQLEQEKVQFAQFISGKCLPSTLVTTLEKENPNAQLMRYCRYTESLIRTLFDKTADAYPTQTNKRTDKAEKNSVQYATWHGVSLRALYRLHDTLMELRRLAETNVNLPLQLTTSLTDWQNERK